jgi:hypothetical protein
MKVFRSPLWVLFLLLLLVVQQPLLAEDNLPAACQTDCVTPFGEVLGKSPNGVPAYSNCSSSCVFPSPSRHNDTYTGIKWQCVEYARRWLLVNEGVVYGDVDYAIDIWDKIGYYHHVEHNEDIPVSNFINGSIVMPARGDLLIYARVMFGGTGHVAVITGVDDNQGYIIVAEQNFKNAPWKSDYTRKIPLIRRGDAYWLLDSYLIGWKRMQTSDRQGK